MIVGITGFICSGKSLVSSFFKKKGWIIIDVDKIGHTVLKNSQVKKRIVKEFGKHILLNSKIDRKRLGDIVFVNKKRLKKLNKIVHPLIKEKVKKIVLSNKNKNLIIDAALLFQLQLHRFCDLVLFIKSPYNLLKKRAKIRGFTYEKFRTIYESQKNSIKRNNIPLVIVQNDSSIKELKNKVLNNNLFVK